MGGCEARTAQSLLPAHQEKGNPHHQIHGGQASWVSHGVHLRKEIQHLNVLLGGFLWCFSLPPAPRSDFAVSHPSIAAEDHRTPSHSISMSVTEDFVSKQIEELKKGKYMPPLTRVAMDSGFTDLPSVDCDWQSNPRRRLLKPRPVG